VDNNETELELTCWLQINNNMVDKKIRDAKMILVSNAVSSSDYDHDSSFVKKKRRESNSSKYDILSNDKKKKTGIAQNSIKYYPNHLVSVDQRSSKSVAFSNSKFPIKSYNLLRCTTTSFDYERNVVEASEKFNATNVATAGQVISFRNIKENGLGIALPSGNITLLKREPDGFGLEHLWNGTINYNKLNIGERILLKLGHVEDVTSSRKQIAFSLEKGKQGNPSITESFEILITNHSANWNEVTVEETLYRWSKFKITASSPAHQIYAEDDVIAWSDVKLKPKSVTKVTYTVLYSGFQL